MHDYNLRMRRIKGLSAASIQLSQKREKTEKALPLNLRGEVDSLDHASNSFKIADSFHALLPTVMHPN